MKSNDNQTISNARRAFFKKIAAAAMGTAAAGSLLPGVLRAAEKQAEEKTAVKLHPMAVKRDGEV